MFGFTTAKPPLTETEIQHLIKEAQSGDLESRETVFLEHLSLAESYAKTYEDSGVPLEDLYQEACYGILVALDHYDSRNNASFKTFCKHYILKYIRLAFLQQNSNLPGSYDRDFYYEIKKYIAAVEELTLTHNHPPSDQEIAEYLNISLLRSRRLRYSSAAFMSPSVDIDEISYGYSNDKTKRPVEDKVIYRNMISEAKLKLTPRELEVLDRRCGFTESGKPETWAHISAVMGYSIPTLNTIFQTATSKMKRVMELDSHIP